MARPGKMEYNGSYPTTTHPTQEDIGMTDANYTEIVAIVDRSGSMHEIKTDTEGGFNAFISDQRQIPGKCLVTLVQFDDRYEQKLTGCPIADVPKLRLEPRGSTALLDAIGRTVTETGQRLSLLDEDTRPGQVIVLILTDGLENASNMWTSEAVWSTVRHQQDAYQWKFLYLGANQDAIKTGDAIGVPAASSISYAAAGPEVQQVWMATSQAVANVRTSNAAPQYSDEDRKLAMSSSSSE